MSWQKLTPAIKNKITADWKTAFPAFGIYKPMHLLRRSGPLVVGILLERNSNNDSYKPIFHIHNLSYPFPVVSLGLPSQVPNVYVHVEWHDKQYSDLTNQLKSIAYLPLSGEISLNEIFSGFYSYLQGNKNPYEPNAFRDLALICGWCGNFELVVRVLSDAKNTMTKWPAAVLKQLGGLDEWASKINALANNRRALEMTTIEETTKHRLSDIPATPIK